MQVKTLGSKALCVGALLTAGAASALADEASLQRQITAQQNQIYQLQQDIAALRGELEQLRYLSSRQGNVMAVQPVTTQAVQPIAPQPLAPQQVAPQPAPSSAMAGPVTPMGNDNLAVNQASANQAAAVAAASTNAPASTIVLRSVDATAQQAYNAAYACVQRNDLKGAQTAFQSYVNTYPDNALTPNAWYWLGQVQYQQAIYDQARLSFLNVARFTDSQKRPDALYKLGMISKFIGDQDKASRYFQLVLQTYPNDAAAVLAQRELQRQQQ